jgi:hypothetical protein
MSRPKAVIIVGWWMVGKAVFGIGYIIQSVENVGPGRCINFIKWTLEHNFGDHKVFNSIFISLQFYSSTGC